MLEFFFFNILKYWNWYLFQKSYISQALKHTSIYAYLETLAKLDTDLKGVVC